MFLVSSSIQNFVITKKPDSILQGFEKVVYMLHSNAENITKTAYIFTITCIQFQHNTNQQQNSKNIG